MTAKGNMAMIHQNLRRLDEAEKLASEVIETGSETLGKDHPMTLKFMTSLASVYNDQSKLAKSASLHFKLLDFHTRILGPNHPETLNITKWVTHHRSQTLLHPKETVATTYQTQER